jgi:hypothetical protein
MDYKKNILSRLEDTGSNQPLFMPDLNLWYRWHTERGTLPSGFENSSLVEIANQLNCPPWVVVIPWELQFQGIEVTREETDKIRTIEYHTSAGILTEKWTLGADGDWWQSEYPVKKVEDLDAAEILANAKTYEMQTDVSGFEPNNQKIIDVAKLPMSPYADLLHTFLGFSEGYMLLLGAGKDRLTEMLTVLETKRQKYIQDIAKLPTSIVLVPDNLDGQYISPKIFKDHYMESYHQMVEVLHDHDKKLLLHVGGNCKHILPLIAEAGIDGVLGISGPPQSNATLSEARALGGPDLTLWGGIPQDYLVSTHDETFLEQSIAEAIKSAESDHRTIIGIADHVPVETEFARLKKVAAQINGET